MNRPRYSVVIQWSEEDQAYVVSLPEWGQYSKTHGRTYGEAARNAWEVLELLMEGSDESVRGQLPKPRLFHHPGADVVDLPKKSPPAATTAAGRH
jgi:antitoxin HicB